MNDSTRQPEFVSLEPLRDNTRSAGMTEPCIKSFLRLIWLLPEVGCISFPGKACSSFTGSTGTGSRIEMRLFRVWCSLEKCLCMLWIRRVQQITSNRIREAYTGERVGQIPGGTSNLEGACYF